MATKTAAPPRLAGTEEVAEFFAIPQKTLVEWRARRIGPAYLKVGRHVRYRWADVEAWLATRQAGRGVPGRQTGALVLDAEGSGTPRHRALEAADSVLVPGRRYQC